MAQHESVTITAGPSKFDLMLSLFDGNKEPRRTVGFMIQSGKSDFHNRTALEVAITKVSQEDGSGESWCFDGCVVNTRPQFHVTGWFRTSSRGGWVKVVEKRAASYIELTFHERVIIGHDHFCATFHLENGRNIEGYGKNRTTALQNLFGLLERGGDIFRLDDVKVRDLIPECIV